MVAPRCAPSTFKTASGFSCDSASEIGGVGVIISRFGADRLPLIVDAIASLRVRSCIIDGEAVACDGNGLASPTFCSTGLADRVVDQFPLDARNGPVAVEKIDVHPTILNGC
jgi:hypothetical protein